MNATYRAELGPEALRAQAGTPTTLRLTVRDARGQAVRTLPATHARPMHLFVVSKDLATFAHVHPVQAGDAFEVRHTFDAGGEYLLVADYAPAGHGQVVDRHVLRVEGAPRAARPLVESEGAQRAGGLAMTLHTQGPLRAGQGAHLHFDVRDAASGAPARDLEPYLGAMAHFVVLSEDGKDLLHVHPMDGGAPGTLGAHAQFPRPGLYKLWVQVQRRGEVVTVPFVLRVGEAAPTSPTSAHHH